MDHAINWFEIPVVDMQRAGRFYRTVLGVELNETPAAGSGYEMAMLPGERGVVSGALVKGEGYTPSQEGVVVYLNGGDDLGVLLDRVEAAGGQVALPKTEIGEDDGFFAYFIDTEGNRIGLHSDG
ncbi:MAG: VOC family protein [Candidatus Promineifilaceae bacterium]